MAGASTLALRHAWGGAANRGALDVLRAELASAGIVLVDAPTPGPADAAKMHGMELVEAAPGLLDLSAVAASQRWARRLPPFVQAPMRDGVRWVGIPLGIHRANMAWFHRARAPEGGWPRGFAGFVAWLEALVPALRHPLAVGAEPWQVGVLFESVVLAVGGPQTYRGAFVERDAGVLKGAAFGAAIDALLRLRPLVDDDGLGLGWAAQRDRVAQGMAAVQVMGDWAAVGADEAIGSAALPGTEPSFVWIADFLAPLAASDPELAHRVAERLSAHSFQQRFAAAKRCRPALAESEASLQPWAGDGAPPDPVPSFTFDQCCSVEAKARALAVLAEGFVRRQAAAAIGHDLAGILSEGS